MNAFNFLRGPLMEEATDPSGGDAGGGEGGGEAAPEPTSVEQTLAPEGDSTPEPEAPNWREPFGEDAQKTLERFLEPKDFGKAYLDLRRQVSEGLKPMQAPGKDATDEQIAAYREAAGIPPEPAGYFDSLPEGMEIKEEDRPYYDALANHLHGANASPDVFAASIEALNEIEQQMADHMTEENVRSRNELDAELREDWGVDYKTNLNVTQALLNNHLSEEGMERLLNATAPDGSLLMANREFIDMLASLGRELNPISTVVDARTESPIKAVEAELNELRDRMKNDRENYFKDDKAQARFIELTTQLERHKQRNQAA